MPPMSVLGLDWTTRRIDALLRRRMGIVEFTHDPDCVLRIAREPARRALTLSDGVAVRAGDPIVQIHFWNERLPLLPTEGLNAAWTGQMKRRIRYSFQMLADHTEREPWLRDVVAIVAMPTYPRRAGAAQLTRTLTLFGFDAVSYAPGAVYATLDSLLALGMNLAFNPAGIRRHGLTYGRIEVWMSRQKLIGRYGSGRRVGSRKEVVEAS